MYIFQLIVLLAIETEIPNFKPQTRMMGLCLYTSCIVYVDSNIKSYQLREHTIIYDSTYARIYRTIHRQ